MRTSDQARWFGFMCLLTSKEREKFIWEVLGQCHVRFLWGFNLVWEGVILFTEAYTVYIRISKRCILHNAKCCSTFLWPPLSAACAISFIRCYANNTRRFKQVNNFEKCTLRRWKVGKLKLGTNLGQKDPSLCPNLGVSFVCLVSIAILIFWYFVSGANISWLFEEPKPQRKFSHNHVLSMLYNYQRARQNEAPLWRFPVQNLLFWMCPKMANVEGM